MSFEPQQIFPSRPGEEPVIMPRAQFRRLRTGWTLLGVGIGLGTAGGVIHSPWLLAGCAIAIAAVILLNRITLENQETRKWKGPEHER